MGLLRHAPATPRNRAKSEAIVTTGRTPRACNGGWGWLNPEYACIAPWVERAWTRKPLGAQTVLASIGANWWRDFVHQRALVHALNGRLTFVGHTDPYPKDLALLLYGPSVSPGYEVWMWANDAHEDGAS